MKLRKLVTADAPFMLEWMHDKNVVQNLQANFAEKQLTDCISFIEYSRNDKKNEHFAIVDDKDEYMGTVSLKNINREHMSAEFAIAIRSCAMGRGLSQYGMAQIIQYGLDKLDLKKIYWCVSPDNQRAVRFYDKNGYQRVKCAPKEVSGYTTEQMDYFVWYEVLNTENSSK